jgi:uncharacterized protein
MRPIRVKQRIVALLAAILLLPAMAAALPDPATEPAAFDAEVTIGDPGEALRGTLFVAAGAGPHPTIVLLHGFPGSPRWASLGSVLQRAGFNVLFFHYRGTWGSDGHFSIPNALHDVQRALAYLRSAPARARYRVDADAIALVGHSMGSWLALQTTVREPAVGCVAGLGLADLGHLGGQWQHQAELRAAWTASIARATHGEHAPVSSQDTPEEMVAYLMANASAFALPELAAPLRSRTILLVGAAEDAVTPVDAHHARFRDALQHAGTPRLTELVLPADHNFSNAQDALAAAVASWMRDECLVDRIGVE